MFHFNDRITLTAANFRNKDDEIVNFIMPFPIDEKNFSIPKDIIQLSIMEGHIDSETYADEAFKICVGKTTNMYEACEDDTKNMIFINSIMLDYIESDEDELCYFERNNINYIFTRINQGDVVVANEEELKKVLIYISKNFRKFKDSVIAIQDCNIENVDKGIQKKKLS